MAISSFSDDVNVIAALGDNPNTDNSLSADQLKAKFDYAAGLIKTYINSTLVGAINTNITNIGTLSSGKADVATTLAGYGITDAMTATAINSALAAKQDTINIVDTPPSPGDPDGIYLVKASS